MCFHFNCQRGGEKIETKGKIEDRKEWWFKMAEAFYRLRLVSKLQTDLGPPALKT